MTMTNIDLDAIRARAEAATRGPWEWDLGEDGKPRRARAALLSFSDHIFWCSALGWPTDADAEFISHARTDVPALIAEVERLRTAVAGIEEALIQAAFMQIALDQCLTVLPVGEWGSTTRAHVPGHWREAATRRAQPYILTVAEVIARADA